MYRRRTFGTVLVAAVVAVPAFMWLGVLEVHPQAPDCDNSRCRDLAGGRRNETTVTCGTLTEHKDLRWTCTTGYDLYPDRRECVAATSTAKPYLTLCENQALTNSYTPYRGGACSAVQNNCLAPTAQPAVVIGPRCRRNITCNIVN